MTTDAHTPATPDAPRARACDPGCETCNLTVREIAEIILAGGDPPECG